MSACYITDPCTRSAGFLHDPKPLNLTPTASPLRPRQYRHLYHALSLRTSLSASLTTYSTITPLIARRDTADGYAKAVIVRCSFDCPVCRTVAGFVRLAVGLGRGRLRGMSSSRHPDKALPSPVEG
jgi:hypothetical protein